MSSSITLGRLRGISIGIHWSVAFFAAFVAYNLATFFYPEFAPGHGGLTYALWGFLAAGLLSGSILAHELGHATTAQNRGIGIEGITLWLLGGVAQMKRQADTPRDAFAIAAAGPAVSVGLALVTGVLAIGAALLSVSPLVVATLGYLALVNTGLALFNMIPALPLDGGRILQSWKWHKGGDREVATVDAARIGRLFGFTLVGLGLVQLFAGLGNGLWTIMLGFFVATRARAEGRHAERVIALRNRRATSPFAPLYKVIERMVSPEPRPEPVYVTAPRIVPKAPPIPVEARRIS